MALGPGGWPASSADVRKGKMRRRGRMTRNLIGAAIVALSLVGMNRAPHAAAALAQGTTAAFDEAHEKALQLLQQRDYFNALKGFQRANQLAGGKSPDAFLGMAQAMQGMKVFKNALDASQSAIDLAQGNARILAPTYRLRGQIFQAMGELRDAETAFRAALTADPESRIADLHYGLAVVLLAEHRDEEAIAELRKELALRPTGTTADEARALIENPRHGSARSAPAFSFVSSDKQRISLESLRGKIVLLDFWASWCDPCRRALPAVHRVQQSHAKDPFVIVGISADRDERAWRTFTGQNHMVWPQYWDRDGALQRTFDVEAIPSYVLIDAEGIELRRVSGSGFDSARDLVVEIDRQIKLLSR
jgi:thiol-disulfide isomerase/thioredoxin/Tfp pilus assembly protein PilF